MKDFAPDMLIIDIDATSQGNVKRIIQAAKSHYRRPFVLLIKSGRAMPRQINYYDHLLSRPFVYRRLKAAIDKLMRSRPGYVLTLPPFALDRRTLVLQHPQGKTHLNPKMAQIMTLLLQKAGSPVSSQHLLKEVWRRENGEDARPLHVHIHWLRKIIEKDVAHPEFLKTDKQNPGYILDLPGRVKMGGEPLFVERQPG